MGGVAAEGFSTKQLLSDEHDSGVFSDIIPGEKEEQHQPLPIPDLRSRGRDQWQQAHTNRQCVSESDRHKAGKWSDRAASKQRNGRSLGGCHPFPLEI